MVQEFRENVENHANVNFCDKIFMILRCKLTPTVELHPVQNFCEKNFRNWRFNHEIQENFVAQKFEAIP